MEESSFFEIGAINEVMLRLQRLIRGSHLAIGGRGGNPNNVISNCFGMVLDVYPDAYPNNHLSRRRAMAAFGSPL
jgi:hypothetical protein